MRAEALAAVHSRACDTSSKITSGLQAVDEREISTLLRERTVLSAKLTLRATEAGALRMKGSAMHERVDSGAHKAIIMLV